MMEFREYRPYYEYKNSGIEWIVQVPTHWKLMLARRLLVGHKQGYYTSEPYIEEGVKLLRISDFLGDGRMSTLKCPRVLKKLEAFQYMLKEGDFTFARTGGVGSFALIDKIDEPLVFAAYLIRFRFSLNKVNYYFLRYFFLSASFQFGLRRSIHGGVNQNVHAENIKDQFCLVPPLEEQHQIASFLDHKTAKIDQLIQEKQELIELLKKKKTALITKCVTKGFDDNVEMKDSGIEWIGKVPRHWEIVALKRIVRLKSGYSINSFEIDESGSYPVMGGNGLRGYTSKYTHFGDYVLIGRQGALCGNINYAGGRFWASEHAVVAHPVKNFDTLWLGELLRILNLNKYSISAAQPGLSVERISNISIPLPPVHEQKKISDFLRKNTRCLSQTIQEIQESIELLQKYRTSLITHAVTGKIDVRDWNKEEPEHQEAAYG